MSTLLESLAQSLGGSDAVGKISDQIGADQQETANAVGVALPALLEALRRNAASPEGANALLGALKRDHDDDSILDRVSDFFGGSDQQKDAAPSRMLDHIFGGKRERVEAGVSQASGLKQAASGQLMKMLAPMVMAAVAKQVASRKLDSGQLGGYLEQEKQQLEVKEKKFSLLGKFMDQDGDGDFDFSDVAKLGAGMLFKRK